MRAQRLQFRTRLSRRLVRRSDMRSGRGGRSGTRRWYRGRRAAFCVNHDSVWVVERKYAVAPDVLQVEHDPGRVIRMTAKPNVPDDVRVVAERRIDERGNGLRPFEI